MRHRLQECSSRSGPDIISQGADLFDALIAARAGVVQAMPPLQARVDGLRRQAQAYLVQESLHSEWNQLWFSQVADELRGVKMRNVGSATQPEKTLQGLLQADTDK